ncbi:MAG: spondin domain-containing protein [Bacteriovoracia bacterium]
MFRPKVLRILPFISVFTISTSALAHQDKELHFRVTVKNVSAANVLSPYLVAISKGKHLFELGKPASPGISTVAETGNTSVLEQELLGDNAIVAISKAHGPTFAGETTSLEFSVKESALYGGSVNLVAMIGKSNDSFIGIQKLPLVYVAKNKIVKLAATNYDAGSEENTGNVEDFGSAGHPIQAAEGFVSIDRGLNLRGNAPESIGWGSVTAVVTIERL